MIAHLKKNVTANAKIKMTNRNSNTPEIIIKLMDDKTQKGKKTSNVEGLDFINPIYEALVSLFRKNLQPRAIVERFAKDENSLREVIATDAFLDYLPANKRPEIEQMLSSGANLESIIKTISLHLSENQRIAQGRALSNAGAYCKDSYFLRAVANSGLDVYINSSSINSLKKKALKTKIIKRSIIGALAITTSLALMYGASFYKADKETFNKYDRSLALASNEYTRVENLVKEKKDELSLTKEKLDNLEKEIKEQENTISLKKISADSMQDKYSKLTEEYTQNSKKLNELEEKISAKQLIFDGLNKDISEIIDKKNKVETSLKEILGDKDVYLDYFLSFGAAYYNFGLDERAKDLFEKSLKLKKDEPVAKSYLGLIGLKNGNPNGFDEILLANGANGTNALIAHNLAEGYLLRNEPSNAEIYYEKSQKLDPKLKNNYFQLGKLYAQKNNQVKAILQLRTFLILENDKDSKKAREASDLLKKINN
jgi:hypothetical protein